MAQSLLCKIVVFFHVCPQELEVSPHSGLYLLVNYKGDCRTAPASPGLLKILEVQPAKQAEEIQGKCEGTLKFAVPWCLA